MNKPKIKQFYLIITCLFLSIQVQNIQAQDFRLGFKGNPIFSSLKPNTDFHNSSSSKIGFSYGVLFDYFLKEHYAIETEFGITTYGGKIEYSNLDTTITSDIKINSIEIPITIKLLTAEVKKNMKVYGRFGMNFAFNTKTNAQVSYTKNSVEFAKDDIKNANKYIQPFNASLVMGAGIEYKLASNLDLVLGFSYTNGFFNVMKSTSLYRSAAVNSSSNINNFDADLNYFAINIGLLF